MREQQVRVRCAALSSARVGVVNARHHAAARRRGAAVVKWLIRATAR